MLLILFSCAVESEKKIQIVHSGIFEKAFIDQSVNAFSLDSILFSGGHCVYHLNGNLLIDSKSELFSIVLNKDPLRTTEPTIITSNFEFLKEEESYDCSVERIGDSLIVCWEREGGFLRIANPIDSILRH